MGDQTTDQRLADIIKSIHSFRHSVDGLVANNKLSAIAQSCQDVRRNIAEELSALKSENQYLVDQLGAVISKRNQLVEENIELEDQIKDDRLYIKILKMQLEKDRE